MISPALIILVTLAVIAILARYMTRWETTCAFASFALHGAFAWLQVWLHTRFYNGVGDMLSYVESGRTMARLMSVDFSRFGWEAVKLFLQIDPNGDGASTTRSIEAATAFILFAVGDSMVAACLFVGALATLGQIYLCCVLRLEVPQASRRSVAVALLLVPSVVFWSSAVTKEGLTLFFFALLAAGALIATRGRWVIGAVSAAVGAVGVAMLKPYLLFPFVLGVVAWVYVARANRTGKRLRLVHLPVAIAIGLLGVAAMGALFPSFRSGTLQRRRRTSKRSVPRSVAARIFRSVTPMRALFGSSCPTSRLLLSTRCFDRSSSKHATGPCWALRSRATVLTLVTWFCSSRLRVRRRALARSGGAPLLAFCVVFTVSFGSPSVSQRPTSGHFRGIGCP